MGKEQLKNQERNCYERLSFFVLFCPLLRAEESHVKVCVCVGALVGPEQIELIYLKVIFLITITIYAHLLKKGKKLLEISPL